MNKKIVNRFWITAIVVLFIMLTCITAMAAETTTVPVDVKYGQTDARSMLDMINNFRTGSDAWYWNSSNTEKVYPGNLSKLEYDYGLEAIAMQRAAEIAVSFSHTRPNGQSCFSVVKSGVSSYGENIAAGYSSARDVFVGWQETNYNYDGQGHRRNMLGSYTHVGIGHVVVNGYHYWVQEFGYGGSGASKTSANDSNTTINVEIDSNLIYSVTAEATSKAITISVGKSTSVPNVNVKLTMYETWPGTPISYSVSPNWSVSGSAISISNGTITAKNVGSSTLTATVLGKKVTVTVNVECTDHKWGSWTATKSATCTEKGSETHTCSVCGKTETRDISAKGHSFGSYKVTKDATCTEKGTETRECSVCGKKETRDIAAKGHTMGNYKVVKQPTKDKEGLEERVCSVCGATEQRTIAKLPSNTPTPTSTEMPATSEAPTGGTTLTGGAVPTGGVTETGEITPAGGAGSEEVTIPTEVDEPVEGEMPVEGDGLAEGADPTESSVATEATATKDMVTKEQEILTGDSDSTDEGSQAALNGEIQDETSQNSPANKIIYIVLATAVGLIAAGCGIFAFVFIRKKNK